MITLTVCLMNKKEPLRKWPITSALRSKMGKDPCPVLLQMAVIQQHSIKFRLIDWLTDCYLPSFYQSALTLLNNKFWGALSESPRHPQRNGERVGGEEDCPVGTGEALPTPPRIQGSRGHKTNVFALIYANPLHRLSHSLLITVLCNRVYNVLHFTYDHLVFAQHLKLQI